MSTNDENATLQILDAFSALRREIGLILAGELKSAGMGYNQMLITYHLTRSPLPMNELSSLSNSDPASTTRTVSALVKAGIVKRTSDSKDSRRSIIELTKKGQVRAVEALKIRKKIGKMLGSTLSPDEEKNFVQLLKKVKSQLSEKHQGVSL